MDGAFVTRERSGRALEVLDRIAFYEVWFRLRPEHASDASFFVTMLGYRWGGERSARRHASRHRWFHQDRYSAVNRGQQGS